MNDISPLRNDSPPHGMGLLVSCEHGGNRIPVSCRKYFSGRFDLVRTHRGFDPGALDIARALANALGAPLLASKITRLVVDLNHSLGHPQLHDETVRKAPPAVRKSIVDTYYRPYRDYTEALTAEAIAHHGRVLHLSCHSFAPEEDGTLRHVDIGLLYDPKRPAEKALCLQWQEAMARRDLRLAIRRNHPYRGDADSQTTTLRRRFSPDAYLGIELEINQRHVFIGGHHWSSLRAVIIETLGEVLARPVRPDASAPLTQPPHARQPA